MRSTSTGSSTPRLLLMFPAEPGEMRVVSDLQNSENAADCKVFEDGERGSFRRCLQANAWGFSGMDDNMLVPTVPAVCVRAAFRSVQH